MKDFDEKSFINHVVKRRGDKRSFNDHTVRKGAEKNFWSPSSFKEYNGKKCLHLTVARSDFSFNNKQDRKERR
jgi:hypothetical protein